jgi:hypothetical protein
MTIRKTRVTDDRVRYYVAVTDGDPHGYYCDNVKGFVDVAMYEDQEFENYFQAIYWFTNPDHRETGLITRIVEFIAEDLAPKKLIFKGGVYDAEGQKFWDMSEITKTIMAHWMSRGMVKELAGNDGPAYVVNN